MYQNVYIEMTQDEGPVVHLWDDTAGYSSFSYDAFHYAYQVSGKADAISLYGNKVKKVKRWAEGDPNVFEADLPRETRILTDLYQESDTPSINHRVSFIDIEVSMEEGIPNVNKAENKILSIALHNVNTGIDHIFILDPDNRMSEDKLPQVQVRKCYDEESLIKAFLETYETYKCTILCGWNSDYFDVPYLHNRIAVLLGDDEAARLSPIKLMKFSSFKQKWHIAGVSSLDYLSLYKKFTYSERPNYRLGTIGEIELGLKKVEYETTLDELYQKDIVEFCKYNLRDVEILVKLDKKLKLIELIRGICHAGHVPYEDFGYSSRWLEGTILTYLHRKGIVAPNKPIGGKERMEEMDEEGIEGFSGAYVKDPKPGRYEWIYSLDLQSLYPSIIMSLNISPETKVGKVLNWNVEQYIQKKITEYQLSDLSGKITVLPALEFQEFLDEGKFTLSSNGILYRTDRKGIIPEILETWFAERKAFQKKRQEFLDKGDKEQADFFDRRQHIQKIFLNSLYGVLGLPIFRFYDVDNAGAVTTSGVDVITTSARFVNKAYQAQTNTSNDYCIYIDTDSLYFSSLDYPFRRDAITDKKLEAITLARKFETELNAFYTIMAKKLFNAYSHRFVIRGESIADAGLWITKKRYALHKVHDLETNKDVDKITVKGMDVVRSSFPTAFRTFMNTVIADILKGKAKEDIDKLVLEFHDKLTKFPVEDVARNTSCKEMSHHELKGKNAISDGYVLGTPAHYKAAINYNRLLHYFKIQKKYEPITDGTKIKWVYLIPDNPLHLDAVAFRTYDDPPQIMKYIKQYVDYELLFESEFKNKLEDFYAAMGWGRIATEVNQKAADFFAF